MSKTINVYTTINSPLKIVWNEVSKLENHTNWMHDAVKIDFLSENNRGLGVKMKVLTKVGPIRLYDYMTVTEWVEEESIGVDHIGIVKGKGRFKLEKIDDNKTLFIWEETLKFPIYLGSIVGEFFGAPFLKLIWKRNLKNLKEIF
tara:strand:+ start:158 stop:592 length:435 start_codon:yes stop_codon:yes gene_type:complete